MERYCIIASPLEFFIKLQQLLKDWKPSTQPSLNFHENNFSTFSRFSIVIYFSTELHKIIFSPWRCPVPMVNNARRWCKQQGDWTFRSLERRQKRCRTKSSVGRIQLLTWLSRAGRHCLRCRNLSSWKWNKFNDSSSSKLKLMIDGRTKTAPGA